MIEIQGVKKAYTGHEVLKGVDLSVPDGSIFGLIGKNGAGKTTLLSILANLSKADSGSITINNRDGSFAKVAFLPDVPQYYDYLSASEYLDFLMMGRETGNEAPDSLKSELLKKVNLDENVIIKTMSRGMRQRLGIAAVLIGNPDVILLDEPTSALDPAGRHEIIEILKTLKKENKTIILSTHILNDMEMICDKVGFLQDGVIKHEMNPMEAGADALEIGIRFRDKIQVSEELMKSVPDDYQMILKDEYNLELRLSDNSDKASTRDTSELFSFVSNLNGEVVEIHTLRPSLDVIFEEVCR